MGDSPPSSENRIEATALQKAVYLAYEAVQKAQAAYDHALGIAADVELSPDGWFALRQQGREYAEAVSQYSSAVRAWLSFMETARADALRLVWKTARRETEATGSTIQASRQNQQFILHSSLLATKSSSPQKLVLLPKQTRGTILDRNRTSDGPGMVLVEIEQEQLLVWKRDLDECAELL